MFTISGVIQPSLCPLSMFITWPVILSLFIKNFTPSQIFSSDTFFFNKIDFHCLIKCLSDCLLFFNVGPGEIAAGANIWNEVK